MTVLVPELEVFDEGNRFRITVGSVGLDTDDNIADQVCDILKCDRILTYSVNILGNEYTLCCNKADQEKKSAWLPTFPLRNSDGEVCDLIANNYVLLKGFDNGTITEMERGELEAIAAQMDRIKDEAVHAARDMLLK